jgi:hypothetical protein
MSEEYLGLSGVREFARWLAAYWKGTVTFPHRYRMRKAGRDWQASSLKEAAKNYEWPLHGPEEDRSLAKNEGRLQGLVSDLQGAVRAKDPGSLNGACKAILRWGGVLRGANGRWLEEASLRGCLGRELARGTAWLENPVGDPPEGFRFNSGLTKIYALLLPGKLVMYDGRVGAALGALAVRFARERTVGVIPPGLRFPWSPGRSQARRKPQPPPGSPHFPKLGGSAKDHALWALRASWLLLEAKILSGAPELRHLEAGLFMLGYDLGKRPGLEGSIGGNLKP